jgi:hypothetical protein
MKEDYLVCELENVPGLQDEEPIYDEMVKESPLSAWQDYSWAELVRLSVDK